MEKNYEFITHKKNGKYYVVFNQNSSYEHINNVTKEINHLLKDYDSKAFVVGDKIELHLEINKLEEQLHKINECVKSFN